MIYIFCATKTEAQAINEHYKLKKSKKYSLNVFQNDNITVIVSGIGKENTQKNIDCFFHCFSVTSEDTFVNIGIAAAPKHYPIGSLWKIGRVLYKDDAITIGCNTKTLQTVDTEQNTPLAHITDMEGFFIAQFFRQYDFLIYKVISDHFEPKNITKEAVKQLLKAALKDLFLMN